VACLFTVVMNIYRTTYVGADGEYLVIFMYWYLCPQSTKIQKENPRHSFEILTLHCSFMPDMLLLQTYPVLSNVQCCADSSFSRFLKTRFMGVCELA